MPRRVKRAFDVQKRGRTDFLIKKRIFNVIHQRVRRSFSRAIFSKAMLINAEPPVNTSKPGEPAEYHFLKEFCQVGYKTDWPIAI
jgi:hypothetical protein